jgi:subtilisin family serine protease
MLKLLVVMALWAPAAPIEDRVIVVFKENVTAAEQQNVLTAQGLKIVDEIPLLRAVLAEVPPAKSRVTLSALAANPRVLAAQHDEWRNWLVGFEIPAPAAVLKQAGQLKITGRAAVKSDAEAPWGVQRVNAPAAWSSSQGSGVKVAVIDTGIDPNQPDLKVAGGINALDKNAPWADDHFHGTHVAGSIAAALDQKGVAGVAPKAELYAVKVLSKDGSGNLFAIMQGIMWTGQNGIQVANMSLGAPQEMALLQYALQMAKNAGVTFIAAAGNDGKAVNWPAAYPETIAVSALCPAGITNTKLCPTANEGISSFSSRGPEVDLIAPGVLIPSTVPLSHDASGVKAYSGTSMAAPHVAGLAALAIARGKKDVLAALTAAATKLPGMSDSEQGAGLVDAAKLVR